MSVSDEIKERLNLRPNQFEGGWFAPVYESALHIADSCLPGFPPAENGRPLCGAIYYFLELDDVSVMHKVTGDMLYHFYGGDPVQMLLLYPDKHTEIFLFSNDEESSAGPMKIIPGGTWLGSRLANGGNYALMGVTMAPGFHPVDYAIGKREDLVNAYPEQQMLIKSLTRE